MSRCGCIFYRPKYNDFLIIKQRESGYWGFPKGGRNEKESPEVCARREVFEELGIIIPLKVLEQSLVLSTGQPRNYQYYLVNTDLLGDYTVSIDHKEIDAYAWMSLSEIYDLDSSKMAWTTWQITFLLKMLFLFAGFGPDRIIKVR